MSGIYGNTMADLRRASMGGVMLGFFAGVALAVAYYKDGRLAGDWPAAIALALVVGSIVPLVVLPSCFFSVRIDEQYITHLFCRRIVLKQRPISQLEAVRVGLGLYAVVFRFADGSRIHFLAHAFGSLMLCAFTSKSCFQILGRLVLGDDMRYSLEPFINSIQTPDHMIGCTPHGTRPLKNLQRSLQ